MTKTNAKTILAVLALASIILLAGCGGLPTAPPITFKAADLFNTGMIGQTWTFQNGYGDITTVEVQAAPDDAAGTQGSHIILHFTKTADRAYWGLNIPQAEDHFLMFQLPSGAWRGVADIPNMPQGCPWCNGHTLATLNWHPVPGMPIPYQIVPASVTFGKVDKIATAYHWWLLNDVNTTDDIVSPPDPSEQGQDMGLAKWESDFSIDIVDTPIYKGAAALSHQFEGACGQIACDEEKWYFAPNIGLVEIQPVAGPLPVDPNLTIKRIR